MSGGQPTPPTLVQAFAKSAGASFITSPFPVTPTGTLGAADLEEGFPPATFLAPANGGVLPAGKDFNGILFLLSAHIAAINAGQPYVWSGSLSTAMGGYAIGAVVQQAADPNAFWINTEAANTANPDSGTPGASGWWSTKPLNTTSAPTAGTHHDVALIGASDEIHDVSTAAGNIVVDGFIPQRDGQRITITKTSSDSNTYTLSPLTGSAAGHQIRLPAGGILLARQYDFVTIQFNATLNVWVQV